jgi:hypothetical protein
VIQFTQSLADAYVRPARNVSMPSMPGRQVRFLQGHAVIKDGRDMVAMMRRADVKIVLTPYAMSWLDEWFKQAGTGIKAEIMVPDEPARPANWDPNLRSEIVGPDSPSPDPGA